MKHITLLFTITLVSLIANAQVPPIASFSFTNTCEGDPTNFTDASSNSPTSWSWDFGDGGGTSTLQNPNYTYAAAGSYQVTLVATNSFGSDTVINFVDVWPLPDVNAGLDIAICEGQSASLSLSGSGGWISITWTPSTGLDNPNIATPTASPTSTTTYTVTATDEGGCSNTDAVTVTVNPLPVANYAQIYKCDLGSGQEVFDLTSVNDSVNNGTGNTVVWYSDAEYLSQIPDAANYLSTQNPAFYEVVDPNGCSNYGNIDLILQANNISINPTQNNPSCFGYSDGTITVAPTGGLPPFTYLWTTSETTNSINVASGSYWVTVTDDAGCQLSDSIYIPNPSEFLISLTTTNPSCIDALNGAINSSVLSGGVAPFNYNWSEGSTTQHIVNLGVGTYYLEMTDANNCLASDTVTLTGTIQDGVISGTVFYQSNKITSGEVELIQVNGPTDLTTLSTSTIDTSGTYQFSSLYKGSYLVKVTGDTSLYNAVPTYFGNTNEWDQAQMISLASSCGSIPETADINLIELPNNTGSGSISGRLVESNGGVFYKAPGDPIGDIDITVEQSPGGSVMGATTTDTAGYFYFDNLPEGSYTVYADMHGYSMDISGTIDINSTNTDFDINLCSDDTAFTVAMCDNPTSIKENMDKSEISIYPNPVKDVLNINTPQKESFNLSITDITGKTVLNKKLITQYNQIDVTQFVTGIYFVRIYNEQKNIYQKLIIE